MADAIEFDVGPAAWRERTTNRRHDERNPWCPRTPKTARANPNKVHCLGQSEILFDVLTKPPTPFYFMGYRFARVHRSSLWATPAMEAGVADHVCALQEIVGWL